MTFFQYMAGMSKLTYLPIDWQQANISRYRRSADILVLPSTQGRCFIFIPPVTFNVLNKFLLSLFSRYALFFFKKQSSHVHMHLERTAGHVECRYYAISLFFSLQFQLFSSSAKANMGLQSVSYEWLSNPSTLVTTFPAFVSWMHLSKS